MGKMKIALAILVLALTGASTQKEMTTKEGWPACEAQENPEVFFHYMQAIATQDVFVVNLYMTQKECAPMKGDMKAEILHQEGPIVLVRVHPEGFPIAMVYTVLEALK